MTDSLTPIRGFHEPDAAHGEARRLVERFLHLPDTERFSARQFLEDHPELRDFPSCVLDLAYEEYCRCRESGRDMRATEFARQFPEVQQSLIRVFEFDQIMHQHPSLMDGVLDEHWPSVGQTFGEFVLLEQIGRGAMSRVFLARQPCLGGRLVVVKVCVRGEREADLLGQLDHRSIAPVHSIHTDPTTGLASLCMPYLTRATLHHLAESLFGTRCETESRRRLTAADLSRLVQKVNQSGLIDSEQAKHKRTAHETTKEDVASQQDVNQNALLAMLPHPQVSSSQLSGLHPSDSFATVILRWGIQLAQGLQHAHDRNILHCDVKPGNVLLMPDLSVRLLDFNLAWVTNDALKLEGGTLPYMASEQLLALRHSVSRSADGSSDSNDSLLSERVSERTDVFGLCATLWHVVTMEPPFGVTIDETSRSSAAMAMLERHQKGLSAESISIVAQILPSDAVELLVSGLDVDPLRRPASAAELATRLSELLTEHPPESSPAVPSSPRPVSIFSGMAVVAMMICLACLMWPFTSAPPPERTAETARPAGSPNSLISPPVDTARSNTSLIHQARVSLQDHRFQDAREALSSLSAPTPESDFLDLYARTCLLPTAISEPPVAYFQLIQRLEDADTQAGGSEVEHLRQSVRERRQPWLDIVDDWRTFTETDNYRALAWWNLTWIHLELEDLSGVESCIRNAEIAGLSGHQMQRMELVLRIHRAQANQEFANGKSLNELRERVEAAGTRGEALAWLTFEARELRSRTDMPLDRMLDRISELADSFRQPELAVESEAVWKILQDRRIVTHPNFLKHIFAASRSPRTSKRNRLGTVLLLTLESSANLMPLVASDSHGR
ncbi:MAG: protein kinase [Planctomycetaceae bacterium]